MEKVCDSCKYMLEKKIKIDAWPDADLYAAICINEDSVLFFQATYPSGTCERWEERKND